MTTVPPHCHICQKDTSTMSWKSYLGHLGWHGSSQLNPPTICPKCGNDISLTTTSHGRERKPRSRQSYLGHLGLHAIADRYFGGNLCAAQQHLMKNGWARQDPVRDNGAWRPYVPLTDWSNLPQEKKEQDKT